MYKYVFGSMESSRILVELLEEGKVSKLEFNRIGRLIHNFYRFMKSIDKIPDPVTRDKIIVLYRKDRFAEIEKMKCIDFAKRLTRSIILTISKYHITQSRKVRMNPDHKFYRKSLLGEG